MRQPNPIAQGMALQILVVVAITIGMIVVATGAGQAQTLTVLHTFASGSNGANPISGLTRDSAGNLYGTTEFGGAGCLSGGCGLVYKVTHHGSAWLETTLYTFTGAPDAAFPVGRVVFGPDGALYGTTRGGGSDSCSGGCGTVFKLQPPPRACGSLLCPWRETILYSFTSPADGAFPQGEVAFDQSGNLYGTTEGGGAGPCRESEYPGCGTVFKLTHNPDGSWSKSTLYSFQGGATDGQFPLAAVVLDQAGNLYGTTPTGGGTGCPDQNNEGCGIVFELSPSGSGWTESIPYDFTGGSDGAIPTAGLIVDSQGNLYGSALYGGQGSGTVFELTSGQGGWNFSVQHSFGDNEANFPGPLTLDAAGNLFGTSFGGGDFNSGTAYKLTRTNGGWTYSTLYSFDLQSSSGGAPEGKIVLDQSGNLYSTCANGPYPSPDAGTVWEITP